jgi:hypothetical protein
LPFRTLEDIFAKSCFVLASIRENLDAKSSLDPLQLEVRNHDHRVQIYIRDVQHESIIPFLSLHIVAVMLILLVSEADSVEIKHKLDNLREGAISSRELLIGIDNFLQGDVSTSQLELHSDIRVRKLQECGSRLGISTWSREACRYP